MRESVLLWTTESLVGMHHRIKTSSCFECLLRSKEIFHVLCWTQWCVFGDTGLKKIGMMSLEEFQPLILQNRILWKLMHADSCWFQQYKNCLYNLYYLVLWKCSVFPLFSFYLRKPHWLPHRCPGWFWWMYTTLSHTRKSCDVFAMLNTRQLWDK